MSWLRTAKRVDWELVRSMAQQVRAEVTGDLSEPSQGACIDASHMLAVALQGLGYDARVHEAYFRADKKFDVDWVEDYMEEGFHSHSWVELDGQVVDPTADQFNPALDRPMPDVYIGPRAGRYFGFDEVEAMCVERVARPDPFAAADGP